MIIPICYLVPSCHEVHVFSGSEAGWNYLRQFAKYTYPENYVLYRTKYDRMGKWVQLFEKGANPLIFQAKEQGINYVGEWLKRQGLGDRKLVTITLREYSFHPIRNSNFQAWMAFAAYARQLGYFIVFLPDTESVSQQDRERYEDFSIFSEGAWNIHLRMGLYHHAFVNMFVNSGPFELCKFSKYPYIYIKLITEAVPQTTRAIFLERGYTPDQQPPFSLHNQLWSWNDDDSGRIISVFNKFCSSIS